MSTRANVSDELPLCMFGESTWAFGLERRGRLVALVFRSTPLTLDPDEVRSDNGQAVPVEVPAGWYWADLENPSVEYGQLAESRLSEGDTNGERVGEFFAVVRLAQRTVAAYLSALERDDEWPATKS